MKETIFDITDFESHLYLNSTIAEDNKSGFLPAEHVIIQEHGWSFEVGEHFKYANQWYEVRLSYLDYSENGTVRYITYAFESKGPKSPLGCH